MENVHEGVNGDVLECVVFELNDGVDRTGFLAAADGVSAWVRTQPGFVSRELFEVGGGRWVDVVRWSTMSDAISAADGMGESAACGGFMAMIDGPSVQMLHGHPAIVPVRA
jgi:hypothetical protein